MVDSQLPVSRRNELRLRSLLHVLKGQASYRVALVIVTTAVLVAASSRAAHAQAWSEVPAKSASAFPLFQRPAGSNYDVVALRIEFQPDSTDFTTGDGTFSGELFEDSDSPVLDALPHDEGYFDAHLQFLENYIARVSDGKTIVTSHLLPVIIQVSSRMGDYAPTGQEARSDDELQKLAALVEEAWTLASHLDSFDMPSGLNPERTAFVIFHAGVGRDVELTGTTLDKTPEDLPSLYFSPETLKRLLGSFDVSVDGLPITNTLLIPRTETRRGFDFIRDEPFLAEFSINGLLAASFLSYLGVPDLFNTESGESAIGPFGVMDGLGIFAYGGLLPPEPSAWTKLFLGWSDVRWANEPGGSYVLNHSGSPVSNDVLIAPVSIGEYFLVENRHRDPEGDGINMRVWLDGNISNVHFDNGSEDFNSISRRGYPGGVVIDADNFEFALPGGKDDAGTDLIGGALVWHIDERIISSGLESNAVNVDPERRGVDVEEADGGQDLGTPGLGFFGPSFEQGSPFDFFYAGNPTVVITPTGAEVRLYENRFGPDTYPSSASNAGGESFIEVGGFSAPVPEMEVTVSRVEASGITIRHDLSLTVETNAAGVLPGSSLKVVGSNAVDVLTFLVENDGTASATWFKDGSRLNSASGLFPAIPAVTNGRAILLGPANFWQLGDDGSFTVTAGLPSSLQILEVTTPVVAALDDRFMVGAVDQTGPFLLTAEQGFVEIERFPNKLLSLAVLEGLRPAYVFKDRAVISDLGKSWSFDPISEDVPVNVHFARNDRGVTGVLVDRVRSRLVILHKLGTTEYVDIGGYMGLGVSGDIGLFPVIADLDDNGRPDILVAVGKTLLAFNQEGAVVNRFPIAMREATLVQPLIVRFADDGPPVVLIAAMDGRMDAYDLGKRNSAVPGFPLSVGTELNTTPHFNGHSLIAMSREGSVVQWDFETVDRIFLGEVFGERNSGFTQLGRIPVIACESGGQSGCSDPPPPNEFYNWPNPIREGVTWIRFKPSRISDVKITIVDLAGNIVDTLQKPNAPAGVVSEIQWQPTVGSGVYFARITETDTEGNTTHHLIKMAVIR